MNTDRKKLS